MSNGQGNNDQQQSTPNTSTNPPRKRQITITSVPDKDFFLTKEMADKIINPGNK